ncbi:MAG: DNA repair protein RecO [Bacteroidetes bacterium]|nr:DNA repair protein RecO [Bacteroidota bacterium]
MSNIKTDAIVLSGFKYGDTSKIVSVMSETSGKFSAIIKGARNSKSKIGGVFENINHISVIFTKKESRDLQLISKAECVSSFGRIKSDLDRLSAAYRMLELTSRSTYDYHASPEIYSLLKEFLYGLENSERNYEAVFLRYQMKLSVLLGIDPFDGFRNSKDGNFVLNDRERNLHFGRLTAEQSGFLQSIADMDFKQIGSLDCQNIDIRAIQNSYEIHFLQHTGKYGVLRSNQIFEELKKAN